MKYYPLFISSITRWINPNGRNENTCSIMWAGPHTGILTIGAELRISLKERYMLCGRPVSNLLMRLGGVTKPYRNLQGISLIHISEPTRLGMISYAVFCL